MLTIRCLISVPQAAEAVARPQIGHVRRLELMACAVAIYARKSFDADASANPRDDGASWILRSGQRAGTVPGIDPASQRSRRGHKTIRSVAPSDRCGAYNRFSMARGAIAQYANDHRELCDISIVSLSEFEKRHREADKARDNVCAGRPLRPYPPDVIER
jgi:hypothetical protein